MRRSRSRPEERCRRPSVRPGVDRRPSKAVGPREAGPRAQAFRSRHRLTLAAEHLDADLLLGNARRVLGDDLALVHHEDAIRERQHLLELQRHEEDSPADIALLDESPMEVLDRSDVQAARGLRGDQYAWIAV